MTELQRRLIWTTAPQSERDLRRDGWRVFQYGDLQHRYINPARSLTAKRTSLERAASGLLSLLEANPRSAVLSVPLNTAGDLLDVYSFLIEPAFRRDISLLLGTDRDLPSLEPPKYLEPRFEYPWTLQRLSYLAAFYLQGESKDGNPPLTPIEEMLFAALRERGLTPTVQHGIDGFRVDFAFPGHQLAVEADGRAWHDATRDEYRDRRLRTRGWETVRFSGSQIYRDAAGVADQVASILLSRPEQPTRTQVSPTPTHRPWWRRLLDWLFRRPSPKTDAHSPGDEPELPPHRPTPEWKAHLDSDQLRAVDAHEGVVQVIAPAGSGKTTTMIARVQELLTRGVAPNRILCTTFNRDARAELEHRLKRIGVSGVEVRNFHALGHLILREESVLRSDVKRASYAMWRRLAKEAMDSFEDGVWIEPETASELVSNYKLDLLWDPDTARRQANSPIEKTASEIYTRYETQNESAGVHDFDDLIYCALRLLQSDEDVRARWQQRWECILVDEYQDIEPAQELLVQLVAAPEDSIFAVGDEDQCIYAWRRASVERIVLLDTVYPGLERVVLTTSYRCPKKVTEAARGLIEHNQRRFPKDIVPSPVAAIEGSIGAIESTDLTEGAQTVAEILKKRFLDNPGDVVVLARTSRLLREVVRACASAEVPFTAPERALTATDAESTVLAYLRLAVDPEQASPEDVEKSFRVPNRYLPRDAAERLAERLRGGYSFSEALESLRISSDEEWRWRGLREWAVLLSELDQISDAGAALHLLRSRGGLDRHYSSVEQMTPHEQVEIEALENLTDMAGGRPVSEFVTKLSALAASLSLVVPGGNVHPRRSQEAVVNIEARQGFRMGRRHKSVSSIGVAGVSIAAVLRDFVKVTAQVLDESAILCVHCHTTGQID